MHRIRILAILGVTALVAACNTNNDVRNGAIGAGIGCVVGELVDDRCVEGAVVGGAGGVLANDI
jgi:hypothetical protein